MRRRTDLDEAQASAVLAGITEVDWEALYHAYGPASDVPVLLGAVTVGDDPTREAAWWELWGNIHPQGSVYEATLPAGCRPRRTGRSCAAQYQPSVASP